MQIAIDGPAGAGKSTVARKVAEELNFLYVDSGAIYRAITYKVLKLGISFKDKNKIAEIATNSKILLKDNSSRIFLDTEEITFKIRTPEITNNVKYIAIIPEVRKVVVNLQRRIASNNNVVMEGRDTTTVVLPHAEIKIYLDADITIRAQRRYKEFRDKGINISYEKVLSDLRERDRADMNREIDPLRICKECHVIDSSYKSIEEVVNEIVQMVKLKSYKN